MEGAARYAQERGVLIPGQRAMFQTLQGPTSRRIWI